MFIYHDANAQSDLSYLQLLSKLMSHRICHYPRVLYKPDLDTCSILHISEEQEQPRTLAYIHDIRAPRVHH